MSASGSVRRATGRLPVIAAIVGCILTAPTVASGSERVVPDAFPTARPASPAEMAVFVRFAPPGAGWRIVERAVASRFALVSFTNGGLAQTALLVRNPGGLWALVTRGGMQMTPADMVAHMPGMEISLAQCLYDLAASEDQR